MAEHRYDPARDRAQVAGGLGARAHVGGLQRRADAARDKSYVLEMLPYPCGEPHIGHLKNYAVGDAVAHFHRRNGRRVLHPMGYDAFGLPAENHAIKTGEHPRDVDRGVDRRVPAPVPRVGDLDRLVARVRHRTSRATTAGRSGSSCSCSSAAWPTARRRRSTGAPRTRPCWPTSRSSTGAASAAARRSRRASSSSGSSASPTTPTGCSTTSTRSTGPSTSRRCSATGSGAPRARRSCSRCPRSASTTRSSRRGPTRCSARRSSSWRPSTPTCCRLAAGTEHEQAVHEYVNRALTESKRGARRRRHATKTGVPLGRTVINPVNGERHPDVRRRLRADGVRHRRDHGRARPRRARLRRSRRPSACRSAA